MNQRYTIQSLSFIAATVCASVWIAATAGAGDVVSGKPSEGLVFVVANDDGMDIWRARLSDGALQQVYATADAEERWPTWSQAAGRLLFVSRNTDGFMKAVINTLDVATGTAAGLGPQPDLVQRSPSWSPDGKFVAHVFRIPASQKVRTTDAGVAVVDLGKATRTIVAKVETLGHRMMTVRYSNSGKQLLGHGRPPKKATGDKLWLLSPSGQVSEIKKIQGGIYGNPRFTRDDAKVVFDYRQNLSLGRDLMMIALAPRSRARRVASLTRADDHSAAPSPVRDEVVFVSDRDGSPDLFRVDLAGGKPVNLTKGSTDADLTPVWSPDGERIAYTVLPKEAYQAEEKQHASSKVRVIDRTGKLLFETTGTMPNWMPAWKGNQPSATPSVGKPAAKATAKTKVETRAKTKVDQAPSKAD